MPNAKPTGYVRTITRAGGDVFYAKLKLPDGSQPQRRLGKAWTKRTRPPEGYLTAGMAEARLQVMLAGDDPLVSIAPRRDVVAFETAVTEWLADRGGECRPSTMRDYESTAKTRLRRFFGDDTPIS